MISCNSAQYGMSKESSYKSRSIQNALHWVFVFLSVSLIAEEPYSLYRIGALALYLIKKKVKGPENVIG